MKKLVIVLVLSMLTANIQAQSLSFEPEIGFRMQNSEVYNIWPSPFQNGTMPLSSYYKSFWDYDFNASVNFNTKIYKRWSITTGFQYFNYRNHIFKLENQPWPVGWDEKVLIDINRQLGLKIGVRYNLFRKSEAKYGASFETGIKVIINQKIKYVLTDDTLPSVPNGYDASKVFFEGPDKSFGRPNNEGPRPYFPYFSIRPYYQINKYLRLIGAVEFNLIMDIIVISNFEAYGGNSININRITPSGKIPGIDVYPNTIMEYGTNFNSWNFSIGLQIPLIKDKPKKPVYNPALDGEIYGL